MQNATRVVGVLMLAASSVYAGQVVGVNPAAEGGEGAELKKTEFTSPTTAPSSPAPTSPAPSSSTPSSPEDAPIVVESPDKATPREGQSVREGQVKVSESGTVEIHVTDADLLDLLRMISAQSQKNIIASKEVKGKVSASLYDVTMKEALDAVLRTNGFTFRERGNFIYVYTAKELQEMEAATRRTQTEVFRLYYTPAAGAVNMIKPVLSTQAQVSFTEAAVAGITTGADDVGGNSHASDDLIVITDYPENLDRVREVLKEIDRRPQQILIEATILRAALTEDNALGVDFNVLAGINFNEFTHSNGQLNGSNFQDGTLADLNHGIGTGGSGKSFSQGINNGLRVGFIQDNISVFLAALEGITDTTVLANPKILALNKQKGEVIVGRKDGYLTTTVTASSTVQTVEFLDTGTRLIFRPFIGDDGFVRMEVHPEDSSGGLTANSNLPFKITTEVTSNIMVKDGHTVVIGGLFRESSDSSRNQVPLLGNIPLAGALFRNQRDRTTREEIIIMLTPHIIKDEAGYSKESEQSRKDFEKLRVGVRKGMMNFGRSRLAEESYEKALAEMAKPNPDRDKALWHLDAATNLNPKFAEAIEMKERLTGVELQESDNSNIRGFLRRRAEAESTMVPTTQPRSRRLKDVGAPQMSNLPTDAAMDSREFASPPSKEAVSAAPSDSTGSPTAAPSTQPSEMTAGTPAPSTRPSVANTEEPTGETAAPSTQPSAAARTGNRSPLAYLTRLFSRPSAPKAAPSPEAAPALPQTAQAVPTAPATPETSVPPTPEQLPDNGLIGGPVEPATTQPSASTNDVP